jgi:aspartyl/asparaginyl beta-hydroxylase (cupin superfamily)
MSDWARSSRWHARHIAIFALLVGPAAWFAPIPTLAMLACGALDVGRHRKITLALLEEYFTGRGLLTWALSPINLLSDLFAWRIRRPVQLEDLPDDCRREIEACVAAFLENGAPIKGAVRPHVEGAGRVMLTFKWFNKALPSPVSIPAFQQNFRYVKTIAVSTFGARKKTSWHFGPQRLTLRVLRTLEPIDSGDVFIAVDNIVHRWRDQPLFIFDDTMFHCSENNIDVDRYCLFMDIVRPNHFQTGFETAIKAMSLLAGSFRSLFYKNWSFVR